MSRYMSAMFLLGALAVSQHPPSTAAGDAPGMWMQELCPEVVDHLSGGDRGVILSHPDRARSLTHAAQAVCTACIVQALGLAVGAEVHMHTRPTLLRRKHKQRTTHHHHVLTAFIDHARRSAFLHLCARAPAWLHSRADLHCQAGFESVRVWLLPPADFQRLQNAGRGDNGRAQQQVPGLVELFFYKTSATSMWPVDTHGAQSAPAHALQDFFPLEPVQLGGVWFMGPRHDFVNGAAPARKLGPRHDFLYGAASATRPVLDTRAGLPWHTSITQRASWAAQPSEQGQALTARIPNLDVVQVDNSIANADACVASQALLTVAEFNAERGGRWLHALPMLAGADIVILNEMDIGMARSGQQHTARALARALGMNYAWGLEFVELTGGTVDEQVAVGQVPNFHGLHGNAFLARCKISDARVFRDQVGPYFSSSPNSVNAGGFEKRLGGRMGLFGRIIVNNATVVVGSTHKLQGFGDEVRAYIGADTAITAGDQDRGFCGRAGLQSVDNASHPTWPASCTSQGRGRGDNICSNLRVHIPERTVSPCVDRFGLQVLLSDHAATTVTLAM